MVIDGSEVLDNPNGSAPGLFIEHAGAAVAALPGPPREMRPMLRTFVLPRLTGRPEPYAWYGEFAGGGVWRIGGG